MKVIKALIILVCIFSISSVNSQNQTEKKEDKVGIFSLEEFSNLHVWVDAQVKEMKLSDELQSEYDALFGLHTGRIGIVRGKNNRDKELSEEEYIKSIKVNIKELNSNVEPLLSADQNKKHLELMEELEKIITNKLFLKKE